MAEVGSWHGGAKNWTPPVRPYPRVRRIYPDLAHSCGWPLTFMVCRGIRRLRRRGRHCSHGRSSEPSKQRKRFQIEVRGMMPAWRCTVDNSYGTDLLSSDMRLD